MPSAVAGAVTAPGGVDLAGDPLGAGYWLLRSDSSVIARGSSAAVGGAAPTAHTPTTVVSHPAGRGFWRVYRGGRVQGFGAATRVAPAIKGLQGRVVGLAAHPGGNGFWRVTSYGRVHSTGDSTWLGAPRVAGTVAAAGHPDRPGYWVLNTSGRVDGYGAARVYGVPAGSGSIALAPHPSGQGYWVLKSSGEVRAYGAAAHHGNAAFGVRAVGIAAHANGGGYWIVAADGRVAAFGSARDGFIRPPSGPLPEVATVGGIEVATTIAGPVRRLLAAAAADGVRLGGWGYRSYARQVQLRAQNCGPTYYDVYVAPSSACSPMTARPGSSMHEQGLAIDFYRKGANGEVLSIAGTRAFTWLSKHADTYGLHNLPSEPWHWSTNGR